MPRAFDDAPDRIAISMGIELYKEFPQHVPAAELLRRILKEHRLTTKPIAERSAVGDTPRA